MENYLVGLVTIAAFAVLSLVWHWNVGGRRPIRFVWRMLTKRQPKSR